MEECTPEAVPVEQLEREGPSSVSDWKLLYNHMQHHLNTYPFTNYQLSLQLGTMNNFSTHNRKNSILEYISPGALSRRRSLEPVSQRAISTKERRSSSLPPLGSLDMQLPGPINTAIPQSTFQSNYVKPELRKTRASSLPPRKQPIERHVDARDHRGRRARATSITSYILSDHKIPKSCTRDIRSIHHTRITRSPVVQLDEQHQIPDANVRGDAVDIVTSTEGKTGRDESMEKQAQLDKGWKEVHQKETDSSSSEKTGCAYSGSEEPTHSSDHHVTEDPPVSTGLSYEHRSLSPSLVTESILSTDAEITQPASPPRPILQPISPGLTLDVIVPPLALPPTLQALDPVDPASMILQGSTTEREDFMRHAISNETTEGGEGDVEVNEVILEPSEVKDTSMDMSGTEEMNHSRGEGAGETPSGVDEGMTPHIFRSIEEEISEETVGMSDGDRGISSSREPKVSLHIGSNQAPELGLHMVAETALHSDRIHEFERYTTTKGQQSRSTSLPPRKDYLDLEVRPRRSKSLGKNHKTVPMQPLVLRNETPSQFGPDSNNTAKSLPSQQGTDRHCSDDIPYRPRPRGRSKKRKPLKRSLSQSYIAEPEAKRIKLRATSIDSAAPQLSVPVFGAIARYDVTDDDMEKSREKASGSHTFLYENDCMVEEEMQFEEAQAALTLARRGLTSEAAIEKFACPETPRTERTLGSSVELVSCKRKKVLLLKLTTARR